MRIERKISVTSPSGATLTNSTSVALEFGGLEIRALTRETPGEDPETRVYVAPPQDHPFEGLIFNSLDSGGGPFIHVPPSGLVSEKSPIIWVQTPDQLLWGRGTRFYSREDYLESR